MDIIFVSFAVSTILLLVFIYLKKKLSYWSDRGVPFVKPEIFFGNLRGVGTTISTPDVVLNGYNELKSRTSSPVGGMFFFTAPVALILNLDLLKNVFVKDFQYFHDRGMFVNERDDPLSAHLFSLEGATWKNLRMKLTPTFTSGKMKMMHSTILAVANQFRDKLIQVTSEGKGHNVELKELLAQFTTDVIGSTAFGVECDSMKNPNSEFMRAGRLQFQATALENFKRLFLMMFPEAGRRLRMSITKPEVTRFFMKLLGETVRYREENDVKRNDFLSLLLQIKNTGRLEGEEEVELGKMSFNELAAQVFLFFIAGFETSSSTMTFAFYEMALNPEVQEKARQEVKEVLQRYNGEMTYEAALELHYIDQVINETLRKYPIVDTLFRKTNNTYKVPDSDITFEKDTLVGIPVLGIHRDPKIYPDPMKFDPERFTKENVAARHPYAWMPFGLGPRNCIGLRFGMMQTRLGIATILNDFQVTPSKETIIPMRFQPETILLSPLGGMHLNLERIH